MASVINTNIASLNAQRNLNTSQSSLNTSLQRLSSGLRINSAKDDAAGLAISDRFSSQIRGSQQASRNANDAISLAQTAEGSLAEVTNNLQRIRELAVQSANASNSASDRASLQGEVTQLLAEIDRVGQNSSFNGVKLLDGSFTAQTFQIGANGTTADQVQISSLVSARTTALGGVGSTTSATVTSTATTTALAAGDLTLNGQQVGASSAGALPGQGAASASSIASAINNVSAQSGVTAVANTTAVTGAAASTFAAVTAGTNSGFSINGVAVGNIAADAGGSAVGRGANVAAAINAVSAQSGVTATANATTGLVSLSAVGGRDIAIAVNGSYGALTADTGLTAATTRGTITLSSTNAAGIVANGAAPGSAGITAATTAATTVSSVSAISALDISTAAGATSALAAIDGALTTVSSARGTLGAIQNRFTSVVSSLSTTVENLSAARSRIQDTDFAAETANLTRAQILQQAGTAILAQANALPNQVLSLLKG